MRKVIVGVIIAAVAVVLIVGAVVYIGYLPFLRQETVEYDDSLTLMMGGGGNSVVLAADDGSRVLVIDTKMGKAARKLHATIRERYPDAEIVVVNTHLHSDHTGGNKLFDGARFIAGAYTDEQWQEWTGGAPLPDDRIEPDAGVVTRIGDEFVEIRNMGQGHTWQDVIVYLHERKMLVTGDLLFHGLHPAMFPEVGTDGNRWIAALEALLDDYPADTVVPGHGPLTGRGTLERMRAYFVDIRDAAGDPARLGEVKKRYGSLRPIPGMSGFAKTRSFFATK
ncbi:MAG: MBL fold metallo-hydrolase [Chitinivibrionales bacterium]|nr:MBL fold metallo-hydrolase [Chitinivibrionales bacterium]